jgi:hypothetical protein
MKNSTWRKIGYVTSVLFGICLGIIIGEMILLNWVGNVIVNMFQLTHEEGLGFINEFMQNIRRVLVNSQGMV